MESLYEQIDLLESEYGIKMSLHDIPLDDKNAWDLICSCDTMGIFQMEGDIGKNIIKQIKPRNIEELSAVNAFVRPGTSGLENYCAAKEDNSLIPKYDPVLDKWLAPTYGAIVYQEEILGLISEMMGVSFGKADIYRRALEKPNKKGNKELFEDFLNNGVTKAVENGINEDGAKRIQKAIIDNAGYLFNKSHSIAYSYISYWTAWVKANYPLVFYLSLFNTEPISKLQDCMQEAIRHGITILPPDISKSKYRTTIEDKDKMVIRMGLHCIKGIGDKAVEELIAAQPFTDMQDYFDRAGKGAGKGVVMAAIKMGALENLPIKINKDFINEEDEKRFIKVETCEQAEDFKELMHCKNVYMNRLQQELWYNTYLENKKVKTIANYALPQDIIRGQYLDNIDMDEVTIEKDNTIVIPADMLEMVGYTEEDVEKFKCRKKPKGFFKRENELAKLTPIERGFKIAYDNLLHVVYREVDAYLSNMEEFEISFIQHPLVNISQFIAKIGDCTDGQRVRSAGIISNIIKRQTKTGKPFYNIILQTPTEKQRLTVWNNVFIENQSILTINHIIKITGKVGFGGITVDTIEDAKANYR